MQPNKPKPTSANNLISIVSSGCQFKGNLFLSGDGRISGTIEGNVIGKQKIILEEQGYIAGKLEAKAAEVSGKVQGELLIDGELYLRNTAQIYGDISATHLVVDAGAKIFGRIITNHPMVDGPPRPLAMPTANC